MRLTKRVPGGAEGAAASRALYRAFLEDRREVGKGGDGGKPAERADWTAARSRESKSKPTRSAWVLLREFLWLLRGYRWIIGSSLVVLVVSVMLALTIPLLTKFAIDNIIGDRPWPAVIMRMFPAGWNKG
ncbi:MAG: hypothetical protein ACK54T_02405, partial [bacterium]